MSRLVVDAGVVARLFFEEEGSDAAARAVQSASELAAPDLIWAEFGNVAWNLHTRGLLTAEQALTAVKEALRLPIDSVPIADLLERAVELSLTVGRTVYDCLYVALAIDLDCPFITCDRRLANALADTPLAQRVRWIGV